MIGRSVCAWGRDKGDRCGADADGVHPHIYTHAQVSWGENGNPNFTAPTDGACANWLPIKTCEGIYQTRMRVYKSEKDPQMYAVAFRPTQQNPEVS